MIGTILLPVISAMNPPPAEVESWIVKVHDSNAALLTVPGLVARERTFDIDVQLRVRVPTDGRPSEFGLTLEIDGAQQWSRTVPGSTPGEIDTLDYHCRVVLETGRHMRLRARAKAKHCAVVSIELSALESRLP